MVARTAHLTASCTKKPEEPPKRVNVSTRKLTRLTALQDNTEPNRKYSAFCKSRSDKPIT